MNSNVSIETFMPSSKSMKNGVQQTQLTFQKNAATQHTESGAKGDTVDFNKKVEKAKKQNGLIEKIADKIKNVTGIGFGSKKLEKALNEAKTEEEKEALIKKYRNSQENAAQITGDVLSVLGVAAFFFAAKQKLNQLQGIAKINKEEAVKRAASGLGKLAESGKNQSSLGKIGNYMQNFANKYKDPKNFETLFNKLTSNKFANLLLAFPAFMIGGHIKKYALKLNRIGTKQYKLDVDKKSVSKEEYKKAKKENKKAKKSADRRNFFSGAINGLLSPVVSALGIVGVPIAVVANSLNRFFIGKRENKGERNLKGFVNDIKTSPITYALGATAIAVPLAIKGHANKVFEKNMDIVVKKLQDAKLEDIKFGKTTYGTLEEIILGNEEISNIVTSTELTDAEKIAQLSEKNIFALKFKQIQNKGDSLTEALREQCPETWSLEEAQNEIKKAFQNKYELQKCVGTGTVAQTFLAKDVDSGKEVCIKMVHKGIDANKIERDSQAIIDLIEASGKTPEEKKFLTDNFKNIVEGVKQEIDLTNEMSAAKRLAEVTKKANVVKPIEVKNNIYVMEKANGVSLATLSKASSCDVKMENGRLLYNRRRSEKDYKPIDDLIQEASNNRQWWETRDKRYYEEIKDLFENHPELANLTEDETKRMLSRYQDVLIEQFSAVDKNGKLIHGDIHPGNVFIDVEKLKAGKPDFFTLIDTGNVIEQNRDMALRFMYLTDYIKNADYKNIANFVLDGATLPEGMTKDKALDIVTGELKKYFFDAKHDIGIIDNDGLLALTDGIMNEHGITPSATQGNLIKAKTSSNNSLAKLGEAWGEKMNRNIRDNVMSVESEAQRTAKALSETAKAAGKFGGLGISNKLKTNAQERLNLRQLSPADRVRIKDASKVKKNGEDYLTYKLKQYKFNFEKMYNMLMQRMGF